MLAIPPLLAYIQCTSNKVGVMKKIFVIILTILSAILILDTLNAGQAVAMFLLAGIIPGTNFALDATRTFEIFLFLGGFTLARIAVRLANIVAARRQNQAQPSLA